MQHVSMINHVLSVSFLGERQNTSDASVAPVGRQDQFEKLCALLNLSGTSRKAVLVSGTPGIGKTLTVKAVLTNMQEKDPATVTVWLSCYGVISILDLGKQLLQRIKDELGQDGERPGSYIHMTAKHACKALS